MMNRRSFLQSSAVGLPAFGALALTPQGPRISNGKDPIVAHLMRESLKAYKHLQSGVTSREVQGLRTFAANARLLQAHGETLGLRANFIAAQKELREHPAHAKSQAAAYVRQAKATLKQLKITGDVGDPLAFAAAYPRATIDFDKLMAVASRTFDRAAAERGLVVRPVGLRRQDTIDVCISNVDEGGCEVHQDEICDTYSVLKMIMQASVLFFGAFCGGCEGLLLLFQIDTLAIGVLGYWNGC